MTNKKTSKKIIANAIVWAAMIIASSLLMGSERQSEMMLMVFVVGWLTTQSLITDKNVIKAECAYFRRLLGRRPKA